MYFLAVVEEGRDVEEQRDAGVCSVRPALVCLHFHSALCRCQQNDEFS